MPVNEAAENILATIGTVLWTAQLVPQVVKSFREKSTEGLSPWLMFIWALSAWFLGVYAIVQNISIPIILQPQLFGALAALSWIQACWWTSDPTLTKFPVNQRTDRAGNEWPTRVMGIMSALLIALGLLPQYWEIWKRKEVVGVSMLFMSVDMLGGVFSVLSLVFQAQFDAVAAVSYVLVVVLDGVVVLAALILNPIAKRRREREDQSTVAPGEVSDLEIGQQLHEGRIVLAEAVAAVQSKHGPSPMKQIE
ncbi:PQ loop repeat protein [Rhizoctonia solani]|uniref:PQ loop repeat protein n=1 Tax=Rhizoctonia solani TaxID=456999 RepID=A0A8H7LIW5_9AGAM